MPAMIRYLDHLATAASPVGVMWYLGNVMPTQDGGMCPQLPRHPSVAPALKLATFRPRVRDHNHSLTSSPYEDCIPNIVSPT
ncbi:hypothetical protein TNCV_3159551 [Trichonephila clavipes]|nr:hypothetical protein TNCV_3159551 [Trichonephila clavipes]